MNIIPENDLQRLAALKRYKILDTPPENAFDHIAKLATRIFNVPISLISLVDAEEVYFKANVGMGNVKSSARGLSLCSLAVLDPEVTVFEDTTIEPCLMANPLVAGSFGLKFYAGAPITTPDGFLIGTLCVIDKQIKSFTDHDKAVLQGLATLVMDDIELRLSAMEEHEKQQEIQRQLAESEFRARLIVNDAPVAISVLCGKDLIIESANAKILKVWDKTSAIIGLPLQLALPELAGQSILQILDAVLTSGQAFYGNEVKILLNRNAVTEDAYFNLVYHPLKDMEGNTNSILVVATEITRQVNSRHQTEHAERRLENMVMNATVGMNIFKGRDLIIELANQPMYEIWGRTPLQALGKPLLEVFPELQGQPFPEMIAGVFDTGTVAEQVEIPVKIMVPEGEKNLVINARYAPLFDLGGQVESVVATIIDITELVIARKLVEESEEHLQAMNEELTSTVEELAVINEELNATNEELSNTQEYLQQSMVNLAESTVLLRKSEDMLRISTEAAEIHTWQLDLNTMEFVSSESLKELLGYSPEDSLTLDGINDQIVEEHQLRVRSEFEQAMKVEKFDVDYMIVRPKDQRSRWLKTKGKMLFDSDQKPAYLSGVIIDITEKKQDELRKNDFIAMVSHELKTPLTSLKGYIQLLSVKNKKNEDAFTTNALGKGEIQLKKMQTIIEGFLNVSEMDAGKINLNKEVFDLAELACEIGKEVQITTTSHHLQISAPDSVSVDADRNKIGQVIFNFLSNAIKYSKSGTQIKLSCEQVGRNVRIAVQDQGAGIREQDMEKLFNRFYRVENKEARTISGFGIGLYICAEIIERHEGKIWIESKVGEGSTFYFNLPAGVPAM